MVSGLFQAGHGMEEGSSYRYRASTDNKLSLSTFTKALVSAVALLEQPDFAHVYLGSEIPPFNRRAFLGDRFDLWSGTDNIRGRMIFSDSWYIRTEKYNIRTEKYNIRTQNFNPEIRESLDSNFNKVVEWPVSSGLLPGDEIVASFVDRVADYVTYINRSSECLPVILPRAKKPCDIPLVQTNSDNNLGRHPHSITHTPENVAMGKNP
jgi:hypothetical protein